ncbi:MAG TPA: hypothetical protein VMR34_04195 [Candidatus Saccharimonadales bacterium]|nr:hypothetical protein [Candidatus Saccharimonadales bacterium]
MEPDGTAQVISSSGPAKRMTPKNLKLILRTRWVLVIAALVVVIVCLIAYLLIHKPPPKISTAKPKPSKTYVYSNGGKTYKETITTNSNRSVNIQNTPVQTPTNQQSKPAKPAAVSAK